MTYKGNTAEKKCSVCENYLRKIEEVERTLTGRETIISAIQAQFKKCETNYKKLFDDYEQLRFEHSSALQDNFSLKEINAKLEELTPKNKKNTAACASTVNRSTPKANKEIQQSSVIPILEEVSNIEKLVESQNQILKNLIEKVINELKHSKIDSSTVLQINKIEEQIESGDHLDTSPKFKKLTEEIEKLKTLVDHLQKENGDLKHFLLEKKNRLTTCTNIPINIKSCDKKDQEILTASDMADPRYNDLIVQLKLEMQEKEKHFEQCSCQLIEQLNDVHDNNQVLSDTLAVITAENKSNLEIIRNLKEELNRASQDCEKKTCAMKCRIAELENDVEDNKVVEKKLRESIDLSVNETQNLKERLKNVIEENCKIKDCKCEAEKELQTKMAELEIESTDLRKELTEKTLELTEYEEENRNFCQKMDVLTKYNIDLNNRIRDLEDEILEKSKEVEKYEVSTQMSLPELSNFDKTSQADIKDKDCMNEKCKMEQIERLAQVERFRSSIKRQLDELDKLSTENDELRAEIDRLKGENKLETEKLQEMVNRSQNQVEMLLKEHDEKTAQIESVANELDNIRRSVTQDNDNFVNQIKQLENENSTLNKIAAEHKKCKDCGCDGAREEIDRLKAELIKKQCIIAELERSVDNFNDNLKNFDKTVEDLACENACLKADRERNAKDVEVLHSQMKDKIKELEKMRQQMENVQKMCERCTKTGKCLEDENKELKKQCETCVLRNRDVEVENELLKEQLEKLRNEKGEADRNLLENYQLQMELENIKDSQLRKESGITGKLKDLQKAYDELKNLYDKRNAENEKLKEEAKNNVISKEDAKKACESLHEENEKMKREANSLFNEVDDLKSICNKLTKDCAAKSLEIECLKETVDEQKKGKRISDKNCQEFKQKQTINEKELNDMKDKLDELRKNYEQKSQELKKIKKQWQSCAKQSQITREEYTNLRKEYKEIKAMLSDQIKRYRLDTDSIEANQPGPNTKDLKNMVQDKESQIMALQEKLKEAAYEIIELKDYIQKLICDNNILKSAINNLIGNLERKIKGPSFGSIPPSSAETIAGEILNSLTAIEDIIIKNGDSCPRGCKGKNCNCMTEICSQYNFKEPIVQTQQNTMHCMNPDDELCKSKQRKKQITDPCKLSINTGVIAKSISEPLKKTVSEPNTTDSDEPHSGSFLDQTSVQFFKETIQDLKTRIDRTMKEKSCDCEQNTSNHNTNT